MVVDRGDVRCFELAVDTEPESDAGDEERGRSADRRVQDTEREERREALTVGGRRMRVAAEHVEAVGPEADLEHAEVLDALQRGFEGDLAQPAREAEPTDVGRDREPVDVDLPR